MSEPIPRQAPLLAASASPRKAPPVWLVPVTVTVGLIQALMFVALGGEFTGNGLDFGWLVPVLLVVFSLMELGFAIGALMLGRTVHRVVAIVVLLALIAECTFVVLIFVSLFSKPAPFDF
jgi:hypothetical protein